MKELDFNGTLGALQGILGRMASITYGNFDVDRPAVAGFAGRLAHAQQPEKPELDLLEASSATDVLTFFTEPDRPFDRSWFILDPRAFESASLVENKSADVSLQLSIRSRGFTIVVSVPTEEYLESLGVEP